MHTHRQVRRRRRRLPHAVFTGEMALIIGRRLISVNQRWMKFNKDLRTSSITTVSWFPSNISSGAFIYFFSLYLSIFIFIFFAGQQSCQSSVVWAIRLLREEDGDPGRHPQPDEPLQPEPGRLHPRAGRSVSATSDHAPPHHHQELWWFSPYGQFFFPPN